MFTGLSSIIEAERFLLNYSPEKQSGETYTLGRMKQLMERLGNPQNDIRAIHVAGTSGKTSTAHYVRLLLEAHGLRVGLTTSPHISSIAERVQVDGAPLAAERFVPYLNEFLAIIEAWGDIRPTYFELLTAFAFWVFKQERVDYMVIEVGLGGLLDATNVIASKSKISVITPIGLDHTEILGSSLTEIANQKAGIIHDDSDVFTCVQAIDAENVIRTVSLRRQARLNVVSVQRDDVSTAPLFQQDNFGLAHEVVRFAMARDHVKTIEPAKLNLLIHNTPPGRFEVYIIGDKTIVLDGAHNPQKLAAFTESLYRRYDGPFAWLIGFIEAPDGKIADCVELIANGRDKFIATQFTVGQDIKGRRSVAAPTLASRFTERGATVLAVENADEALEALLQSKQRTVVVTGSLYLVAILRQRILELAKKSLADLDSVE
ncbi:MAG: Mur ligase family protein [Patescibacteria group bacterium]